MIRPGSFVNFGINQGMDIREIRRLKVFNSSLALSVALSLFLGILFLPSGHPVPIVIFTGAAFICSLLLVFNNKNQYKYSLPLAIIFFNVLTIFVSHRIFGGFFGFSWMFNFLTLQLSIMLYGIHNLKTLIANITLSAFCIWLIYYLTINGHPVNSMAPRFGIDILAVVFTATGILFTLVNISVINYYLEVSEANIVSMQNTMIDQEKRATLGQVTASLAHEIKNPLNLISNFSMMNIDLLNELKSKGGNGAQGQSGATEKEIRDAYFYLGENSEKIVKHSKIANETIQSILFNFSTNDNEEQIIDLNSSLESSVKFTYHGFRTRHSGFFVQIDSDYDENIPAVKGNPIEINRIFINLVDNALYSMFLKSKENTAYTPTLTVQSKYRQNRTIITIRDNGSGIEPDKLNRIFTPLYTDKPAGTGTGLGLWLAMQSVEKYHGKLTVDSAPPEYACFTLEFPATGLN